MKLLLCIATSLDALPETLTAMQEYNPPSEGITSSITISPSFTWIGPEPVAWNTAEPIETVNPHILYLLRLIYQYADLFRVSQACYGWYTCLSLTKVRPLFLLNQCSSGWGYPDTLQNTDTRLPNDTLSCSFDTNTSGASERRKVKKASILAQPHWTLTKQIVPQNWVSASNNSGTERTENMKFNSGVAPCYLVGGCADIVSIICPDNRRYDQLAPVGVKMMTRRVKRGGPGWRRHRRTASKLCFQTRLSLSSWFAHTIECETREEGKQWHNTWTRLMRKFLHLRLANWQDFTEH